LARRVLEVLEGLPRSGEFVFPNPATGRPRQDIQGAVERAREASGLSGVWVHDLRRSFVTQARRSGLPESVVARFSGHRTAAVFKRYNIVEEQDLKAAVAVLNQVRTSAPAGRTEPPTASRSAPTEAASQAAPTAGHETDNVDEECG
jgi:integrase